MGSRPRVLVLADCPGWAWEKKATQYRRWLSDAFDVTVGYRAHYYRSAEPEWSSFDLVHTFEFPQVDLVSESYRGRLLSGLTMLVCARRDGAVTWPVWGDARVRAWAERCDALHGNSSAILEAIAGLHARTYYLPNGMDPDFWRRDRVRPMRRITAAHIGKPKEHKGYPLVGEVCAAVEVPVLTAYRTVHNALSPEDVRELYQDSHVYIVYSTKDGTPCVALEAAACENAIVANDVGNMREFLDGGGGGLLIERTPEALADALLWCRDHPDDVIAMGRAARRRIEAQWTWQRQCERVRALWREVLGV